METISPSPPSCFFLFSFSAIWVPLHQLFYNFILLICLFQEPSPTFFLGPETQPHVPAMSGYIILFFTLAGMRDPRVHSQVNRSYTSQVGLNLKSLLYDLNNLCFLFSNYKFSPDMSYLFKDLDLSLFSLSRVFITQSQLIWTHIYWTRVVYTLHHYFRLVSRKSPKLFNGQRFTPLRKEFRPGVHCNKQPLLGAELGQSLAIGGHLSFSRALPICLE